MQAHATIYQMAIKIKVELVRRERLVKKDCDNLKAAEAKLVECDLKKARTTIEAARTTLQLKDAQVEVEDLGLDY